MLLLKSSWFRKFQRSTVPFPLLAGSGTEEVNPVTGLRAALEHKGFSQGNIWSHFSPFQLYCKQSPLFAFIL